MHLSFLFKNIVMKYSLNNEIEKQIVKNEFNFF
jgi:hypothetical protein